MREVPLPDGDIHWVFPTLTSSAERDRVCRVLLTADDAVFQLGQRLGARSDAHAWGVPLNRFYYQRLGPEPKFPVTVLAAEGGSDQILVDVVCAPAGGGPYLSPGPPWQVDTTISISCDSNPKSCTGHEIDARMGRPVGSAIEAAAEIRAATEWLLHRLVHETEQSLRAQDQKRGHTTPRGDE